MNKKKFLKVALIGLLTVMVLTPFLVIAFVFSVGEVMAPVYVDATVLDRETGAPVPGCTLDTMAGTPPSSPTDAQGRSSLVTGHSYGGTLFYPGPLDRDLKLQVRFFLGGQLPHEYPDEAEDWTIDFYFHAPWLFKRELTPQVQVGRSRHRYTETETLPIEAADRLVRATVRFEKAKGREAYRIPLTVLLDKQQIALCQARPPGPLKKRADDHRAAGRYAEALDAYREAATDGRAWAYQGMGFCLWHLDRKKESIEAHGQAARRRPKDADVQYWYANSLVDERPKQAVPQFEKVIALEPRQARGYVGLGNALYHLNRDTAAVQAFERAVKLCATCLDEDDRERYEELKRLAAR